MRKYDKKRKMNQKDERKEKRLFIRVTENEKLQLKLLSQKRNLGLSAYFRHAVNYLETADIIENAIKIDSVLQNVIS